MTQNIGIDLGLGFVKTTDGRTDYIFPSVVGAGQELTFQSELTSFTEPVDNLAITVAGKKYFIGELAIRQSEILSRSLSDNHAQEKNTKIILLAVLALYCEGDRGDFNVITGLPPGFYLANKDDLAALIQGTHQVVFNMDGIDRKKTITVSKVKIIPQPMGTLFHQIFDARGAIRDKELARSKVGIIDIGYRTTDFVLVDKLEYIDKLSITKTTAMSNVYGIISDYLHREFHMFKEDFDIEGIIRKGELKLDGEVHSLAAIKKEAAEELAFKILTELNSIWDKRTLDTILLSGGGGAALADYLLPELKTAVPAENPQTANVRGYLKLGQKVFGRDEKISGQDKTGTDRNQPAANVRSEMTFARQVPETPPQTVTERPSVNHAAEAVPGNVPHAEAAPDYHATDAIESNRSRKTVDGVANSAIPGSAAGEVSLHHAPNTTSGNFEMNDGRGGNDPGAARDNDDSAQHRRGIDKESFRSNLDKLFSR